MEGGIADATLIEYSCEDMRLAESRGFVELKRRFIEKRWRY